MNTCLVEICMYFCTIFFRYLTKEELLESPVIYTCPGVSQHIRFTLWQLCNSYNFALQTVPQNVYNYLKTANLEIFDKLKPMYDKIIHKQ